MMPMIINSVRVIHPIKQDIATDTDIKTGKPALSAFKPCLDMVWLVIRYKIYPKKITI